MLTHSPHRTSIRVLVVTNNTPENLPLLISDGPPRKAVLDANPQAPGREGPVVRARGRAGPAKGGTLPSSPCPPPLLTSASVAPPPSLPSAIQSPPIFLFPLSFPSSSPFPSLDFLPFPYPPALHNSTSPSLATRRSAETTAAETDARNQRVVTIRPPTARRAYARQSGGGADHRSALRFQAAITFRPLQRFDRRVVGASHIGPAVSRNRWDGHNRPPPAISQLRESTAPQHVAVTRKVQSKLGPCGKWWWGGASGRRPSRHTHGLVCTRGVEDCCAQQWSGGWIMSTLLHNGGRRVE